MKKLPPQEAKRILEGIYSGEKPFEVLPNREPEIPYGPSPQFEPAFILDPIYRIRHGLHKHTEDRLLLHGGVGGGKTAHVVAIVLSAMLAYPGLQCVIGSLHYTDVRDIIIPAIQELFTVNSRWDHPLIAKVPNDQTKYLQLINGSSIQFLGFEDEDKVRGRNIGLFVIEEISRIVKEGIIDESAGRLRTIHSPIRQLIATSNPTDLTHFMYRTWNMHQFRTDYKGEKLPIGEPCNCQFCPKCLDFNLGEFEYDEYGYCSNPKCIVKTGAAGKLKPSPNGLTFRRPVYRLTGGHEDFCPGNQEYWRVLFSDATGNFHTQAGFTQGLKRDMDSRTFDQLAKGKVIDFGIGNMYDSYTEGGNLLHVNVPYDPTRDLHWSFDFNKRPQCSVVAQERYYFDDRGNKDVEINFIKEIVLFDTVERLVDDDGDRIRGVGPEHAVQKFAELFPPETVPGTVYLWGEHNGHNRPSSPNQKTNWQVIVDMMKELGYKVKLMVKKVKPGGARHIPIVDRVVNSNFFLRDPYGKHRIKINKDLPYLQLSFKDLKWKIEDGKSVIDDQPDKNAAKAKDTSKPRLVSHITDAATYYIVQRFNLTKTDGDHWLLILPGEGGYVVTAQGTIKHIEPEKPKEEEKVKEPRGQSLLEYLNIEIGSDYDDDDVGLPGFFGGVGGGIF